LIGLKGEMKNSKLHFAPCLLNFKFALALAAMLVVALLPRPGQAYMGRNY